MSSANLATQAAISAGLATLATTSSAANMNAAILVGDPQAFGADETEYVYGAQPITSVGTKEASFPMAKLFSEMSETVLAMAPESADNPSSAGGTGGVPPGGSSSDDGDGSGKKKDISIYDLFDDPKGYLHKEFDGVEEYEDVDVHHLAKFHQAFELIEQALNGSNPDDVAYVINNFHENVPLMFDEAIYPGTEMTYEGKYYEEVAEALDGRREVFEAVFLGTIYDWISEDALWGLWEKIPGIIEQNPDIADIALDVVAERYLEDPETTREAAPTITDDNLVEIFEMVKELRSHPSEDVRRSADEVIADYSERVSELKAKEMIAMKGLVVNGLFEELLEIANSGNDDDFAILVDTISAELGSLQSHRGQAAALAFVEVTSKIENSDRLEKLVERFGVVFGHISEHYKDERRYWIPLRAMNVVGNKLSHKAFEVYIESIKKNRDVVIHLVANLESDSRAKELADGMNEGSMGELERRSDPKYSWLYTEAMRADAVKALERIKGMK